ncbi:hypothetical protein [Pollutibacter soli]|uniref:hypothetical protein n=1 Tax=Pollutibacter soli TaxID=3034157 RepID=UPI003013FCE0
MLSHIVSILGFVGVFFSCFEEQTFVGSTPADPEVRKFLEMPLKDSVDFIRWKLLVSESTYKLEYNYGVSKPGTPGFYTDHIKAVGGQLTRRDKNLVLTNKGKILNLALVNRNILHLINHNGKLISGNGGYSYALNNIHPELSDQFNLTSTNKIDKNPEVFEGRTPCQEISAELGLNKTDACTKMKWYIIFYRDSATGKPSHYLSGGRGYRKETMEKGTWKMLTGADDRIIYEVYSEKYHTPIHLVKGDDNILFFTDASGKLLVGNEDFSFTLNKRDVE